MTVVEIGDEGLAVGVFEPSVVLLLIPEFSVSGFGGWAQPYVLDPKPSPKP